MATRRQFVFALGATALSAPLASFAQQPGKIYRIGYLSTRLRSNEPNSEIVQSLRRMRELGYVEGKNLLIEWRFADGKFDRLPGFAAELVKLKLDLIVAAASPAIRAAQQATSTIPIVFSVTGDPVGSGFVASLARPKGNITGLSLVTSEVSTKRLELLMTIVPKLSRVGVLGNPGSSTHVATLNEARAAAQKVGIRIVTVEARTPDEIERGFAAMVRERVRAVVVPLDALVFQQRRQIAELAIKHRLLFITSAREYAEAGGLMSYGQNIGEHYRRAATYVDKILKGAKPADLPVEQPTKFELVNNMKTAKALGIKIPQSLFIRADKVIE